MSPGIVTACVGEERRSATAKGSSAGMAELFCRRSQKKLCNGQQFKKIHGFVYNEI